MAWEVVSAEYVSRMAGLDPTELRDEWYDFAVDFIRSRTGLNVETGSTVTEKLNGTGSRYIRVSMPPISSVSSLKIEGIEVPSNLYSFSGSYIFLTDEVTINPHVDMDVFPVGVQNIEVTYTFSSPDDVVSNTIAMIVKELATAYKAQGASIALQSFVAQGRADNDFRAAAPRVYKRISDIVCSMLKPTKFRAR